MTFEYQPEHFLRVAETLEYMSNSINELYPSQRDALLAACLMLRSAERRLYEDSSDR
jgi:hypothetical protein